MKSPKEITKELEKVISNESNKLRDDSFFKESENMISSLKRLGLIGDLTYNYPMIDTLGKDIYVSLNQRTNLGNEL